MNRDELGRVVRVSKRRVGKSWEELGRVGKSLEELGRVGKSWEELGIVILMGG